ncbi:hypothetical protein EON81_21265 [bacterium]|nr:MAG: hypothetical protein EON81_21265 [bacterium]
MRLLGIVILAFLAGCGVRRWEQPAVPDYTSFHPMDLKRKVTFERGEGWSEEFGLTVMDFWPSQGLSGFFKESAQAGFQAEWALLRNPGRAIYIFEGKQDRPLTEAERSELTSMAKRHQASVITGRVWAKVGPDGKTPMVMKSLGRHIDRSGRQTGDLTIYLTFDKRVDALAAAKYIDPRGYKVRVSSRDGKTIVEAGTGLSSAAETEETEAFTPLAQQFRGDVTAGWSESPTVASSTRPGR